jgi:hypothetical protein
VSQRPSVDFTGDSHRPVTLSANNAWIGRAERNDSGRGLGH